MATKYTILETAHTEESEPFSSKGKAVEAADAAAEEYPGTPFRVATGKGTVVHTAFAESVDVVDETPADEVPEVQVDDEEGQSFAEVLSETMGVPVVDVTDEDTAADSEADTSEDNTPDDKDEDAGQDADEEDSDADNELDEGDEEAVKKLAARALRGARKNSPGGTTFVSGAEAVKAVAALADTAPAAPVAAPTGATLELAAANTNAKRMHYRTIGETRTACGSATTSRRANAHQIETASLCTACEKLADGAVVDTRPAGTGRAGSGSRKSPKKVVVDAGEIRDLVARLKAGEPCEMETVDGMRLVFVAGDPVTGEESAELGDIQSINIVAS